jgi:hypothetical protein
LIGNQSWFVQVQDITKNEPGMTRTWIIPHVIGLCRMHHDDVENHSAWIKLEEDGRFVWYDRSKAVIENDPEGHYQTWVLLGPLDPQPAVAVKTGKKPRKPRGGPEKPRERWTVAVPKDEQEDGAKLLDEAVARIEELLGYDPARSKYYSLIDGLNFGIMRLEEESIRDE